MKQFIMALLATAMLAAPTDATALTLMQQRQHTTTQTKKKQAAKTHARKPPRRRHAPLTLQPRYADCRASAQPCRRR